MRGKRSRNAGSSTQHATPLETDGSASLSPAKVMKPSGAHAEEQLQPNILNAFSPAAHQTAGESDQLKMGDFLEKCHYCQKRIAQNSEVFMYSNLCAFCSAECRDFQMAKDQLVETQSVNPREKIVPGPGIYNVKG
ncbi:FCS-Like Zinc finger 5-like [Primulina tabacum]|uniref:FCS-Like Zinc finger 5-like n=1 Tax=Primulina tabacum TaxID=48773 RepID=UPI003F596E9B